MTYYVYILANRRNGTLYIGITNNLVRRVYEHRNKLVQGFSQKYDLDKLVYYEEYQNSYTAIQREKNLKHYVRKWKLELIEKNNAEWNDLYDDIL